MLGRIHVVADEAPFIGRGVASHGCGRATRLHGRFKLDTRNTVLVLVIVIERRSLSVRSFISRTRRIRQISGKVPTYLLQQIRRLSLNTQIMNFRLRRRGWRSWR